MKLHLGSGGKNIPGFINIDIREDVGADVIWPAHKISEFTVFAELIYNCHLLEHFPNKPRLGLISWIDVLKDWYNALLPGGILRISVPDTKAAAKLYVEGSYNLEKFQTFFNGRQDFDADIHYTTFDKERLTKGLIEAGFKDITEWDWRTVEHSSVDDYSQAYLPHMDKENGVQMSLNLQAIK